MLCNNLAIITRCDFHVIYLLDKQRIKKTEFPSQLKFHFLKSVAKNTYVTIETFWLPETILQKPRRPLYWKFKSVQNLIPCGWLFSNNVMSDSTLPPHGKLWKVKIKIFLNGITMPPISFEKKFSPCWTANDENFPCWKYQLTITFDL